MAGSGSRTVLSTDRRLSDALSRPKSPQDTDTALLTLVYTESFDGFPAITTVTTSPRLRDSLMDYYRADPCFYTIIPLFRLSSIADVLAPTYHPVLNEAI